MVLCLIAVALLFIKELKNKFLHYAKRTNKGKHGEHISDHQKVFVQRPRDFFERIGE
jgi:hypothetical protein